MKAIKKTKPAIDPPTAEAQARTLAPAWGFLLILTIALSIWSCGRRSTPDRTDKFVVRNFSIPFDTTVWITHYYQGIYYCLTVNKQFICLNDKFEVDSIITNSINTQNFDYAYLAGDTLVAVTSPWDILRKSYFLNSNFQWQSQTKESSSDPFYEDDNFLVSTCCNGEFGGAVFFMEKQNNRVFSLPATCATIINKLGDFYFLTISLAHGQGSTEVLKIEDPTQLYELTEDSLKNNCHWWYDKDYGNEEFLEGTQKMLDTLGLLTLTSFIFQNKLYHICTDFKSTYIAKIQDNKLIWVDSLSEKALWSHVPRNMKHETLSVHSFYNREVSGFFTIKNDTISIVTFDKVEVTN